MNPLDLLKVKFQVSTRGTERGIGRGMWFALREKRASEGWRGLYRGLSPNVTGNASSWGLYFLLCVLAAHTYLLPRRSLNAASVTINSSAARPKTRPTGP